MLHGKFKFYLIVSLKKSNWIKKDLKKDVVFPLSQALERKNYESNLWPSDSALQCSTTKSQRLYGDQHLLVQ